MSRTALLIRCSTDEAERIRIEAQKEQSTLSSYVLNAMMRTLQTEDILLSKISDYRSVSRHAPNAPGPRTTLLVRCSIAEAERIREAAKRRELPINAFVLQGLNRVWTVQSPLTSQSIDAASPTKTFFGAPNS
jgi:uncharacterized protein (DUF1778 family)